VAPLWKRPTENGVKAGSMRSTTTHWTWYIDKKTSLLNRVEMHSDPISVSAPVSQGKTMMRRTLSLVATLSHTVSSVQANPQLADSLFVFKAPPGATMQKPESEPVKGSK